MWVLLSKATDLQQVFWGRAPLHSLLLGLMSTRVSLPSGQLRGGLLLSQG